MYDDDEVWGRFLNFVLGILLCAGLWWVTCWAFGHSFEWKEFLGICCLMTITKAFLG